MRSHCVHSLLIPGWGARENGRGSTGPHCCVRAVPHSCTAWAFVGSWGRAPKQRSGRGDSCRRGQWSPHFITSPSMYIYATIPHSHSTLADSFALFHSIWRPEGGTATPRSAAAASHWRGCGIIWHDMWVCTNEKGSTFRRGIRLHSGYWYSVAPSFTDVFFLVLTCLFSPWTLCWMQEERRKREEAGASEFWLLPSFAHIISAYVKTYRKKEKLPKRRRRKRRRRFTGHWVQLQRDAYKILSSQSMSFSLSSVGRAPAAGTPEAATVGRGGQCKSSKAKLGFRVFQHSTLLLLESMPLPHWGVDSFASFFSFNSRRNVRFGKRTAEMTDTFSFHQLPTYSKPGVLGSTHQERGGWEKRKDRDLSVCSSLLPESISNLGI